MNKIHIVYSLPPIKAKYVLISRVFKRIFNIHLYRFFFTQVLDWPQPIQAPFSITKNLLDSLSKKYRLRVYSLFETIDIDLKKSDLFIGHPWPDFTTYIPGNNKWVHYDKNQITNKVIIKYPNDHRVFIISPFNHSLDQCGWLLELSDRISNYIAISGDYWIKNLSKSSFANRFSNLHQVCMAIESNNYPKVKVEFNPINARKFLYIGRVSSEKNIKMLESIAKSIRDFQGGFIGDGNIKGWEKISDFRSLTPEYIRGIANEYDFFINLSTYDAQVTTVLEAVCWGFIVLCTPGSGYEEDCIVKMSTNDLSYNINQINRLQNINSQLLFEMADTCRKKIVLKYSWEKFNSKIEGIIQ